MRGIACALAIDARATCRNSVRTRRWPMTTR